MAASTPGARAAPVPPELRWRHVFRGDEAQIPGLRRWLAGLLPECAARDDVITVAAELATNAVKHTASGPRLIGEPMAESGRGLLVVRELSARTGVTGDERGRLVWADVTWAGDAAVMPAGFPDGCQAAIRDGQQLLARRHTGAVTWFGRATMQWWALTGCPGADHLVAADSPQELSRRLDALQALTTPPLSAATAAGPAAARAGGRDHRHKAPVPPRPQGATRAAGIRFQPC